MITKSKFQKDRNNKYYDVCYCFYLCKNLFTEGYYFIDTQNGENLRRNKCENVHY